MSAFNCAAVFACKLSMALFTLHGMDEQLLRRELLEKGMTPEEIQNLPLSFWKRRCRRIIDRPEVIAPRIDQVVQVSGRGTLKCVSCTSLVLQGMTACKDRS